MQIGGPQCGCGNRGCFEALASRTAIERDIREGDRRGPRHVLTEILEGDLSVIRSGALRKALEAGDELVTEVMRRASEVLGYACLTVRHLIDPEVIVLGGGVVEACSDFILPIVENIVGSDQLPGAREGGRVLLSALGDDAVVLGRRGAGLRAAAAARSRSSFAVKPDYPPIAASRLRRGHRGRQDLRAKTFVITVNGKVKSARRARPRSATARRTRSAQEELKGSAGAGPRCSSSARGHSGQVELTDEADDFLAQRSIECEMLPTPEAVEAYNDVEATPGGADPRDCCCSTILRAAQRDTGVTTAHSFGRVSGWN